MRPSDARIKELTPLVRHIAWKIHRTMPYSIIDRDDLEQIGMLGLLDAFRLYKEMPGAGFRTYASNRIHGAIMDELRERDPIRRVRRQTLNDIERTSNELQGALGRPAMASEIADKLKITLKKYHRALAQEYATSPTEFNYVMSDRTLDYMQDSQADPYEVLATKRKFLAILELIEKLPTREKRMIRLYYAEALPLKAIGYEFDLSESMVCLIIKRSIRKLRIALVGWQ